MQKNEKRQTKGKSAKNAKPQKKVNHQVVKHPNSKSKNKKDNEFAIVAYFFLVLFLTLIGYICYFQMFRAEDVVNNTYNKRQNLYESTIIRGNIMSSDGVVLAKTIMDEDGNEIRNYPLGKVFAHAVGYSTNGTTGVESIANFSLLKTHTSIFNQISNLLYGYKNPGDSVVTTFDSKLQQVAYEALGYYDGAIIAMDPQTGEILAMVSKPDYDPNQIVTNYKDIIAEGEDGKTGSALVNRTTQGRYTPGSIFKVFTALEYVRQSEDYSSYTFDCKGEVTEKKVCIRCIDNTVHGTVDLQHAFAYSCNGAFATMGLSLDMDLFSKTCNQLLFGKELPIEYPYSKSVFELSGSSTPAEIMRGCFGQHTTTVSPLHMLLIMSSIANDGVLMKPQVIDSVVNDANIIVEKYENEEYGRLLSVKEAKFLQECMRLCVEIGSAYSLQSEVYTAYGKTGSAQISDTTDDTHGWFVGYATDEQGKQIAVSIIVEKAGGGSKYAVPIAKKIFEKYFLD